MQRAEKLPKTPPISFNYAYIYRGLGKVLLLEGKNADAVGALQKAVQIGENQPGDKPYCLYELACARALLSFVVGAGRADLTGTERETKNRDAEEAMKSLREAVAAGWENARWMKSDPDLESIRSRDDFQALIAQLELKSRTDSAADAAASIGQNPKL